MASLNRSSLKKKILNVAPIKRVVVTESKPKSTFAEEIEKAMEEKTQAVAPIEKKTSEPAELKSVSVATTSDLIGALQGVDKKYETITDADFYPEGSKVEIPDSLNLTKVEVPTIDEEKIKAEVVDEETKKTQKEKKELEEKTQKETDSKLEEIKNLKSTAESEKLEIGKIYDDYKVSAESDAIKRGLARSSVAILSIDNIEASRAKELSRVAENLTLNINAVESQIKDLQVKLDDSLNNLDLELAVNINSAIEKKIKELKDAEVEAIEFNNKVNELEAKYKASIAEKKKEQAEYEEELKQKYQGVAEENKRQEKLDIAMDYFATMDKTTALKEIIQNSELARVLGDSYYDLYYYIMRR